MLEWLKKNRPFYEMPVMRCKLGASINDCEQKVFCCYISRIKVAMVLNNFRLTLERMNHLLSTDPLRDFHILFLRPLDTHQTLLAQPLV